MKSYRTFWNVSRQFQPNFALKWGAEEEISPKIVRTISQNSILCANNRAVSVDQSRGKRHNLFRSRGHSLLLFPKSFYRGDPLRRGIGKQMKVGQGEKHVSARSVTFSIIVFTTSTIYIAVMIHEPYSKNTGSS